MGVGAPPGEHAQGDPSRKSARQRNHQLSEAARAPAAGVLAAHALRTAAGGTAAKGRKLGSAASGSCAVRSKTPDGRAAGNVMRCRIRPVATSADPFPIELDGRHYLFVEEFSLADGRGVISGHGAAAGRRRGLHRGPSSGRDHHLSYPFVFDLDGTTYMLPETGDAGRIELYRSVEFPDRWELDRVLLDGITAFDATLHLGDDGPLWLFTNVGAGPTYRGEFRLCFSRALDGRGGRIRKTLSRPIRAAPGRPAGSTAADGALPPGPGLFPPLRRGGRAPPGRRAVDDGLPGNAGGRIAADWMPGIEATHTYTFDSKYECLDAYRHVRRLAAHR